MWPWEGLGSLPTLSTSAGVAGGIARADLVLGSMLDNVVVMFGVAWSGGRPMLIGEGCRENKTNGAERNAQ